MNPLIFVAVFFLQAPVAAPVDLYVGPVESALGSMPIPKIVGMTGEQPKPKLKGARIAMYSAAALDVVSTMYVLKGGGYEANPVFGRKPSLTKLIGLKALGVAVNDVAGQYLLRKGKVGQAKFIYWFSSALWYLAAAWNFRVIGR